MMKSLTLAMIVSALQMVLPIFTQVIVDRVLVERDVALLHLLIISMIAVLFFMIVAMTIQRYLLSFAAVRIDSSTLDFLTRKLLLLPMSYFNTRRTGDIQRRLQGMRWIREFLSQNGITGLTASVQLLAAILLMLVYSPLLTLVFLATAPFYAALMFYSRRWLRPIFDETEEAFGRYSSYQIDAIEGMETVKAMGAEATFREAMLDQFHRIARRIFRADFTIMCYEGAVQTVTFLSVAFFLWIGAGQVMDGKLTIGGLVAFNSLVALANGPIATLLSLWDNLQMASILLNRLQDVFEQEPEQGADHSHLRPVKTLEGRVRFQNLAFRYGGPDSSNILEGISLEVPPGKTVAIVGRSGSGKTTLMKCLSGLLEPTEGTIYFDGVDMKTLNYRDLRQKIGFVLQESYLFDDTIAHNIAFGDGEPNMDQVLWAARAAHAHEFIERLPLGYDTRIGDTGIALSGGQKQRVAIARALYNRPPVLIFDEATSSLDTESERAIKENMDKLLEGRTSFVIAHRLSTVRDADFIVVLEKGKIAEQGTHDELMNRQGLYFYLCSQQLGL
jgi:ABC-type bacteriocin/lantibiotic exporter with double-glycine peptidase domain